LRIGIDLGGTKTEVIALSDKGEELFRHRVNTPRDDYQATVQAIVDLVTLAEQKTGETGTVGLGIPGTLSPYSKRVKNANSTWLNGQPLDKDLAQALNREVRIANDANCLAVSEAIDGAGAGQAPVWRSPVSRVSGATAMPVSGATIRCRGWMRMSCATVRKCPVIAGSRAVLRPLFQAPVLVSTISG
jgi:fructokinase